MSEVVIHPIWAYFIGVLLGIFVPKKLRWNLVSFLKFRPTRSLSIHAKTLLVKEDILKHELSPQISIIGLLEVALDEMEHPDFKPNTNYEIKFFCEVEIIEDKSKK